MKHPFITGAFGLFTAGILYGCQNSITTAAQPVGKDTATVVVLQDTMVSKEMVFPAELIPYASTKLTARVAGYLKTVQADIGDRVKKGQLLATVDAPELPENLARYQADAMAAKARFLHSRDLYERYRGASNESRVGIIAAADLEKAKQAYQSDSAIWLAAQKMVASSQSIATLRAVLAPFNGVIVNRLADPGARVGNDQPILEIQDNHVLRLRVAIPEQYLSSGAQDPIIRFRVEAYPEKVFEAKLTRKTASVDPVNRTETWEYQYNNTNGMLKAGSFAYVVFHWQRDTPSFLVPATAVVTNQEKKFVIRVQGDSAVWTDVRQGVSSGSSMEIFGQLSRGDTILLNATDEKKPGYKAVWRTVH
jgi:RND family efflux transporter MFP subunit